MDKNIFEDKDIQLFNEWKKKQDKESFLKLYKGFGGLIHQASQKASYNSQIPKSVFKLEAAQQFYDALHRFNPNQGVKLSTFLHNAIENKLKRINYKYQNLARITERSGGGLGVYHIGDLMAVTEHLRSTLNREPTVIEIAKEMNVTPEQVLKLQQEMRRDLSLNAEIEDLASFDDFAAESSIIAMHYYDMNPEEQLVFDYATGSHGKPAIKKPGSNLVDWKKIAKTLNMSEDKVQRIRKSIVKKFSR